MKIREQKLQQLNVQERIQKHENRL
jgi:hypothetical protein